MKPFSFFKFVFAIAMTSIVLASCGTDDTGGTGSVVAPKVDLVAGTGIITSDATIAIGETFTVNLVGTKGDNAMKSITVNEAGTKISDLARLSFSHTTGSANPIVLTSGNTSAFDIKVTVKAHTDISAKAYSFIIADDKGNTTTKTLTITTQGTPPVFVEPTESSSKVSVATSGLFVQRYKVTKGTGNLASIEVSKDGVKITDLTTLYIDNLQTNFSANPQPIEAANQGAYDKQIFFRAPATVGIYVYTTKFIDVNGLSTTHTITVTVGTSVNSLAGILLNQSGPAGQGGLDLDTGASTGTVASNPSSADAEIRDEGVVNVLNDGTWRPQISGMNGSVIKYIKKGKNGISENFDFANIKFKEEIAALWTNGEAFTLKSLDGLRDVSAKVEVNDIFIVNKGGKYYLLTVKSIKVTTAVGDNSDSYTFDVKF
ncbi:MAG: hypothetical protein IPO94_15645 [Saprospiraceae bacterium]|nr:hypothetical protein [Saprospiraceae bacterium]